MKILATSDLHGHLPEVPECDLLLIGGDVCPDFASFGRRPDRGEAQQSNWLRQHFRPWLEEIPAKQVVGIAGNHDFVFEHTEFLIPRDLRWTYLRDEAYCASGVTIYGIPWVPNLSAWAFYLSDDRLDAAYAAINPGVDIVLSHGPPYGYCDFTAPQFGALHAGADAANGMLHHVKPRYLVCGHIHEGRGSKMHRNEVTDVVNVSYLDEMYEPHPGGVVELHGF